MQSNEYEHWATMYSIIFAHIIKLHSNKKKQNSANEKRRYMKRRLSLSGPMYVLNTT